MNEPKTFLEPLAGYLIDVFAKLRNRPFVPHSLTKLQNLKLCRDLTDATTVVEIGSYKGITARRLSYLFEKVVTVEIDPSLHAIAKKKCSDRSNVELLLGDGSKLLPDVARRINKAVIYLDGHFSGGCTGIGDEPEPVLKELELISNDLEHFRAVVVDDFRLFGSEKGWPSKADVMAKLESMLPSSEWQHYVLNDQFVCIREGRHYK